jgi:broad specificity phosphatase PhoE
MVVIVPMTSAARDSADADTDLAHAGRRVGAVVGAEDAAAAAVNSAHGVPVQRPAAPLDQAEETLLDVHDLGTRVPDQRLCDRAEHRIQSAVVTPASPHNARLMGTLYLVRHGQASFGAADYDQLSPLGQQQSLRLGQWFRERGMHFDAVLTGTLRRHAQTVAGIGVGMQVQHDPLALPGLNEYDGEALVRAIHPGPIPAAAGPEQRRLHFGLLRQGLQQWMAGTMQPAGMPAHADFVAGVVHALDHVRTRHADDTVLVVSSGGPIATAIGHVLGLDSEAVIELNLHIRNSALSEFKVGARRHSLITFNTLPHLDGDSASVTYA